MSSEIAPGIETTHTPKSFMSWMPRSMNQPITGGYVVATKYAPPTSMPNMITTARIVPMVVPSTLKGIWTMGRTNFSSIQLVGRTIRLMPNMKLDLMAYQRWVMMVSSTQKRGFLRIGALCPMLYWSRSISSFLLSLFSCFFLALSATFFSLAAARTPTAAMGIPISAPTPVEVKAAPPSATVLPVRPNFFVTFPATFSAIPMARSFSPNATPHSFLFATCEFLVVRHDEVGDVHRALRN